MIRLAVFGVTEQQCEDLARRIRGVELAWVAEQSHIGSQLAAESDAVVFFGLFSPDIGLLERLTEAGKHVLLATETALTIDNLESVIDLGVSRGVRVIVVNPDRMLPSRQLVQDELLGTKFGTAGLIRVHRWQPSSSEKVPTQLPAALVRDLDLVLWLTQQLPCVVFAIQPLPESSRMIQVHLGFADGGMALIDFAGCLPSGDGYQSLSAICSTGAMYADDHANSQLAYRGGAAQTISADEGLTALVNCVQRFTEGLKAKGDVGCSLAIIRIVVDAVMQSIETGRAVSLEK